MESLKITNVEFDLICGFFHVEFDNGRSVQCCLAGREDGKGYRKAISRHNNGHDRGICRDTNAWAVERGEFDVNSLLLKQARKAGLRII